MEPTEQFNTFDERIPDAQLLKLRTLPPHGSGHPHALHEVHPEHVAPRDPMAVAATRPFPRNTGTHIRRTYPMESSTMTAVSKVCISL